MIYQLKYTDKEAAQIHLKEVGVLQSVINYVTTFNDEGEEVTTEVVENEYTSITHAVVYIGAIVDVAGTYDDEGNELTPTTFVEGYHVDVMTKTDVDFGTYVVTPNNPKHNFSI
jgi:hypothetical protein